MPSPWKATCVASRQPAAAVQIEPAAGVPPRIGADLDQLVARNRIETLHIGVGPVAVELPVPGAERKAAAGVDAGEVRIEAARQFEELAFEPHDSAFDGVRRVRLKGLRFFGLLGGNSRGARVLRSRRGLSLDDDSCPWTTTGTRRTSPNKTGNGARRICRIFIESLAVQDGVRFAIWRERCRLRHVCRAA